MGNLRRKIERAIKRHGAGWVFSRKDLRDITTSGPVGVLLSRLVTCGMIRRIGRGLYDYPRKSKILDQLVPPDIDQAAQAIARKHRWTITPSGATAANTLGLDQQVPAQIIYLSDGPARKLKAGEQTITFRHADPKDLRMENYSSRVIIQALKHLGKDNVDDKVLAHLRRMLPKRDKANLIRDARYGTDWILGAAQKIAQKDEHE